MLLFFTNAELENVKIEENLAVNPIKFAFIGSSGTIEKKDTEDFFDTRLKQNIAWACYNESKTVSEIAREIEAKGGL